MLSWLELLINRYCCSCWLSVLFISMMHVQANIKSKKKLYRIYPFAENIMGVSWYNEREEEIWNQFGGDLYCEGWGVAQHAFSPFQICSGQHSDGIAYSADTLHTCVINVSFIIDWWLIMCAWHCSVTGWRNGTYVWLNCIRLALSCDIQSAVYIFLRLHRVASSPWWGKKSETCC